MLVLRLQGDKAAAPDPLWIWCLISLTSARSPALSMPVTCQNLVADRVARGRSLLAKPDICSPGQRTVSMVEPAEAGA